MFLNSSEALDWLYNTQLFGMKLGLEGITRLLRACDLATLVDGAPDAPQIIHVAGTNGKGSTCAMMESIGRASGYKTGMFTSPHLVRFHERLRVNNQMIDDATLCRLIQKLHDVTQDWDPCPTFFELATALGLMYFEEQGCDLILLETGMGGRLDATNAVAKSVAVLVPIGLDHTQYLGDTLAAIAGEKAGIITSDLAVICAVQAEEAMTVIRDRCSSTGSELQLVDKPCDLPLGLLGQHQAQNAALAVTAMKALPQFRGNEESIAQGLKKASWAGRFEKLKIQGKACILDGAHNAHAMRALVETWQSQYGDTKPCCIFAAAEDKDVGAVLDLLAPLVGRWVLPVVQSPRIAAPEQMEQLVRRYSSAAISTCPHLSDAFGQLAEGAPNLICGSLFLVGETKALLEQSADSYRKTMQ
ncbi:MAG: folylpolyglutamate synthase/dihydrofolate synthase family protein [Akkermansia sp.]